ncbi:uncharacterized protein BDR25DRAFT_360284 [Lindgomyces ingoldianus]|uniref:Uncharacterized protein n=1 Tax=Lindgomyces ingoldianus TaxID=673940 RepID=A0ACB6QHY8_9PLEO|nr:uncharacterized protein BDR25DRAFT_360284 [Lindgomyces ingoldianus]KAF2465755.1 hypothetical protein BDR25DRAFT_360284 [Lindgomyces ingoldianus]
MISLELAAKPMAELGVHLSWSHIAPACRHIPCLKILAIEAAATPFHCRPPPLFIFLATAFPGSPNEWADATGKILSPVQFMAYSQTLRASLQDRAANERTFKMDLGPALGLWLAGNLKFSSIADSVARKSRNVETAKYCEKSAGTLDVKIRGLVAHNSKLSPPGLLGRTTGTIAVPGAVDIARELSTFPYLISITCALHFSDTENDEGIPSLNLKASFSSVYKLSSFNVECLKLAQLNIAADWMRFASANSIRGTSLNVCEQPLLYCLTNESGPLSYYLSPGFILYTGFFCFRNSSLQPLTRASSCQYFEQFVFNTLSATYRRASASYSFLTTNTPKSMFPVGSPSSRPSMRTIPGLWHLYDPTKDITRRIRFDIPDSYIYSTPSKDGVIVLENATIPDIGFLNLSGIHPPQTRFSDSKCEDECCKNLLLPDAGCINGLEEERESAPTLGRGRGGIPLRGVMEKTMIDLCHTRNYEVLKEWLEGEKVKSVGDYVGNERMESTGRCEILGEFNTREIVWAASADKKMRNHKRKRPVQEHEPLYWPPPTFGPPNAARAGLNDKGANTQIRSPLGTESNATLQLSSPQKKTLEIDFSPYPLWDGGPPPEMYNGNELMNLDICLHIFNPDLKLRCLTGVDGLSHLLTYGFKGDTYSPGGQGPQYNGVSRLFLDRTGRRGREEGEGRGGCRLLNRQKNESRVSHLRSKVMFVNTQIPTEVNNLYTIGVYRIPFVIHVDHSLLLRNSLYIPHPPTSHPIKSFMKKSFIPFSGFLNINPFSPPWHVSPKNSLIANVGFWIKLKRWGDSVSGRMSWCSFQSREIGIIAVSTTGGLSTNTLIRLRFCSLRILGLINVEVGDKWKDEGRSFMADQPACGEDLDQHAFHDKRDITLRALSIKFVVGGVTEDLDVKSNMVRSCRIIVNAWTTHVLSLQSPAASYSSLLKLVIPISPPFEASATAIPLEGSTP